MTYKQANAKLENNEIDGFSMGERVYALKNVILRSEDKKSEKVILAKTHLIAKQFSAGRYWFDFANEGWFYGRKSHFGTFPEGKVVLETWKVWQFPLIELNYSIENEKPTTK